MKKQRQYYEEAIGEQNRQHKIVVGIKKGRILELEGLLKSAEEEGQTLTVER